MKSIIANAATIARNALEGAAETAAAATETVTETVAATVETVKASSFFEKALSNKVVVYGGGAVLAGAAVYGGLKLGAKINRMRKAAKPAEVKPEVKPETKAEAKPADAKPETKEAA